MILSELIKKLEEIEALAKERGKCLSYEQIVEAKITFSDYIVLTLTPKETKEANLITGVEHVRIS
jgi:hypothetical protein